MFGKTKDEMKAFFIEKHKEANKTTFSCPLCFEESLTIGMISHLDDCCKKWHYAFDSLNEEIPCGKKRKMGMEPAPDHPYDSVDSPLSSGSNFFEVSLDNGKLRCVCGCNEGRADLKVRRAPKRFDMVHVVLNGVTRLICKWTHFKSSDLEQKLRETLSLPSARHIGKFECRGCKKVQFATISIHPPSAPSGLWHFCNFDCLLDFGKLFLAKDWTTHCRDASTLSQSHLTSKEK